MRPTLGTCVRLHKKAAAVLGMLLLVFVFVWTPPVHAQTELAQQVAQSAGLSQTPISIIIARIIRAFIGTLGVILVILVMYGGWLYMTAAGDTEKINRAKTILKNGIIGLLIIFSAFAITQFILGRLLEATGLRGISATTAQRYGEPLGSALNGRIIQDHYPPRDALDIPRNTRMFVTFVEAVAPSSIIDGWTAANPSANKLNTGNVKIFETAKGEGEALATDNVLVMVTEDHRTFVFDPVDLLGNAATDTNYSVVLKPDIKKDRGGDLFTGRNNRGYEWTFEVSTVIDLTPPTVVSIVPAEGQTHDRNMTIEVTFSEAMDPLSAQGIWKGGIGFSNIAVNSKTGASGAETRVDGAFELSNGYRTSTFTTIDPCAKDECGNIVYCLPASSAIKVEARAATVDENNKPQAKLVGGSWNGLVDAAGNSLDGNDNNEVEGPPTDSVSQSFNTNNNIDNRTPAIASLLPGIRDALVDPTRDVEVTFTIPMKTSTLTNSNIQLWPDPYYGFWFSVRSDGQKTSVNHPALVQKEDGGWNYYPVITQDVKGANQFCLFPSVGPKMGRDIGSCETTVNAPYCCDGNPSATACTTRSGTALPPSP